MQEQILKSISISSLNQWSPISIRDFLILSLKKVWISLSLFLARVFRSILILLIGSYRSVGTTHLGGCCRFEPSCSAYALQAVKVQPLHKAMLLIIIRILKCRPGGSFGFDPVPAFKEKINAAK